MLHLHRAQDLDVLHAAALDVLAEPLPDPFEPGLVMVGTRATARHLQQLGAHRGPHRVWANVDALTPQAFVRRITDAVLGPLQRPVDPWDPGSLAWLLAEHLHDLFEGPDADVLEPLRRATGPDAARVVDRRTLVVAADAARLFDRYALHRPRMLAAWRQGRVVDADGAPLADELRWQPALLRALDDLAPVDGPARRVARAEALLAGVLPGTADTRTASPLPTRPCVVGVATLPRLHLDLLLAVARDRDVHLFVPTLSPAEWRAGTLAAAAAAAAGRDEVELVVPAAPLLRSAGGFGGRAAAAFARAVDEAGAPVTDLPLGGSPPAGPTRLLAALHRSLHDDVPVGADAVDAAAVGVDDRSVVFHAAPGPLRQVEALRDELRRRFDDDPTLQPRDVLVLTPDLASFGPLARAVLGAAPGGHDVPALPVRVAGAHLRGNAVAAVLRRAVRLVTSRASAAEVLDLCSSVPVRRAFGLTPGELATVERWVRDTGVRWGRDGADRARLDLPARRDHTWAAAVDRLLVGVAMADEDDRRLGSVVPYDHVEDAGDLDLLERLLRLLSVVDDLAGLRRPRGLGEWHADLVQVLDRLVGPDEPPGRLGRAERDAVVRERRAVVAALDPLRAMADLVGRDVGVDAVTRWVVDVLDDLDRGGGGGAGRITVAELGSVRDLPHRVVCLLGLDDGSVPRGEPWAPHDLVAASPRPGDRDRRSEDRRAVVGAVVAARDALVVTWGGRDQRTGRARAAALPVQELRDVVRSAVGTDGLDALTTEHPVLPTSPALFRRAAPVTYDADRLGAARAAARPPTGVSDFVPHPVPLEDEDGEVDLALDDLVRVAAHPLRALVRSLRLRSFEDLDLVPDVEPVELDHADRSRLGRELLAELRPGDDVDAVVRTQLSRGGLPPGALGAVAVRRVTDELRALLAARRAVGQHRSVRVDVDLGAGRSLVGSTPAHADEDGGLLVTQFEYVRNDERRLVPLWLRQQALAASTGLRVRGAHLGRPARGDGVELWLLPAPDPDDARAEVLRWAELVDDARVGRVALPPRTAMAWWRGRRRAEQLVVEAGEATVDPAGLDDDALRRLVDDDELAAAVGAALDRGRTDARRAWEEGDFPERDDGAARLLLRHARAVDDLLASSDLTRRARRYEPMLAAREAVDPSEQATLAARLLGGAS